MSKGLPVQLADDRICRGLLGNVGVSKAYQSTTSKYSIDKETSRLQSLVRQLKSLGSAQSSQILRSHRCEQNDGRPNSQAATLTDDRFFYGQGIAGLFLPPYTESFGRRTINIVASAGYAIACVIVGVPQSLPAVVVGRFFSEFLSALPVVASAGSIEDMWEVRARIWAIDVWIKGSIIGIALGPCMGTYISTASLHW